MIAKNVLELQLDSINQVSMRQLKAWGYVIEEDKENESIIARTFKNNVDIPTIIEMDYRSNIEYKLWNNKFGKLHRERKPAVIYYSQGKLLSKEWYTNSINYCGESHCFSAIEYHSNGLIRQLQWTNKEGIIHHNTLPALIDFNKGNKIFTKKWYTNGNIGNCNPTLPTTLSIKDNNIISYTFYKEGYNITDKVKEWSITNAINPLKMSEEEKYLFLLNFF